MLMFFVFFFPCRFVGNAERAKDRMETWTNLSPGAAWRGTMYDANPWDFTPSLPNLTGFDVRMIGMDLLHLFHLGVGRDMIGSAMRILCRCEIFSGSNLDKKLAMASAWLRRYVKQSKLQLALKKFTKSNLGWNSKEYPEIHCKGYDTYVILKWLVHEVIPSSPEKVPDDVATILWSADSLLGMLMNTGRFLSDSEMEHKRVIGMLFLRTYLKLAGEALQVRQRFWRVRPKFHILTHVVICERRLNVHWSSCWVDEDAIKRFMRITKRTHKRRATDRCLHRWLLALRPKLLKLHPYIYIIYIYRTQTQIQ